MATSCTQGKYHSTYQMDEEEEEEALSLCDLPVNLMKEEEETRKADSQAIETEEEFDFYSWGGPISAESEMCAADEIFFQGQILPLRFSFSSDSAFSKTGFGHDKMRLNRSESGSESTEHGSLGGFGSNSSRSSSLRSHNSSSSTSSTTIAFSKPRVQNQFHTHPSPKPHLIKVPSPRQSFSNNQARKSSAWDFFRLGVVPAPEIGLHDLKVRSSNSANKNSVSRNSSSGSSSSNSATERAKTSNRAHTSDKRSHYIKQFMGKGSGLLSGCKCSIETVQPDLVLNKSGSKSTNKTESETHAMKDKVVDLKKQKQRKKAMSRRRTYQWLQELSHAGYRPDEEALLSNS